MILWPLILATLSLHITLESKFPIPQQLNKDNLHLITRKKPTRTGVIPMTKTERFGRRSDELVLVLLALHGAQVREPEPVKLGGRFGTSWVVRRRIGGRVC